MAQEISRKINILEAHSSLGYAGGQRNLVSFCKYLDKSIFNVFALGYVEGGVQENKLYELGIESFVGAKDSNRILEFIKEKKIDVIHIHRSGHFVRLESDIISGARKINPSIVIVEKNVFGKFDPVSGMEIDCHMFQSIMHLNERYLPASREKFDFSKHKVFYNLVDSEEFEKYRLSPDEIMAAKARLGISKDDFVIGKVARPHIAKWSDLVLDMMPYLVRLKSNVKFIIVGVPESRKKKILAGKLSGNFILLDEITDEKKLHELYQVIDVLAHSSKIGECNGNTINESMFWGKPVVTNSTPKKDNGQLEQVVHLKNGIIANYPQTFARALEYLANNSEKRREMGENGRKQVLTINNPLMISSALSSSVFEQLLNRGINVKLDNISLTQEANLLPGKEDILAYREEYKRRLDWEFGKLSNQEKAIYRLKGFKRLIIKIADYLEDKYGI